MNLDYTLEECLGKNICVKVFQEEDRIDTATEIWQISKPADYEAFKQEMTQLIEINMLKDYYLC